VTFLFAGSLGQWWNFVVLDRIKIKRSIQKNLKITNMAELIIRDEIEKHELESFNIYARQEGSVIPTQQQLIDHIFTKDKQARNKFEDLKLLLIFKTAEGKEFTVCIWELQCSAGLEYIFYGYCDVRYYGSGLHTEKEGYGFRLIGGNISYNEDGAPNGTYFQAMPEKTFHR
jgi:hypothetical protein